MQLLKTFTLTEITNICGKRTQYGTCADIGGKDRVISHSGRGKLFFELFQLFFQQLSLFNLCTHGFDFLRRKVFLMAFFIFCPPMIKVGFPVYGFRADRTGGERGNLLLQHRCTGLQLGLFHDNSSLSQQYISNYTHLYPFIPSK